MDLKNLRKIIALLNPDLSKLEDEVLEGYILLTQPLLEEFRECLGDFFVQAMAYALCHQYILAKSSLSLARGEVSSISQRDTTISFSAGVSAGSISLGSSYWTSSPAGSMLLELLDSRGCFTFFANGWGGSTC